MSNECVCGHEHQKAIYGRKMMWAACDLCICDSHKPAKIEIPPQPTLTSNEELKPDDLLNKPFFSAKDTELLIAEYVTLRKQNGELKAEKEKWRKGRCECEDQRQSIYKCGLCEVLKLWEEIKGE